MQWPPNNLTYLGITNGRPPYKKFGIKQADRLYHTLIIGKTGTGKSTLIKQMILQDIQAGRGCCLIDPHGDLVEDIARQIPEHRKSDLVYLNVPNVHQVYGYNPLKYVSEEKRSLAASGVLEVFKKRWGDSWGVRMEHILRNCIMTLLETPNSNLSDILKLLSDDAYRTQVVANLKNPQVKLFWKQEFGSWSKSFKQTAIAPIQNKVGAFLTDPNIRRVLISHQEELSFRRIMDEQKILLVNLSKGKIGEDAAGLLGGLLVTTLGLAGYSRADIPKQQRKPFHIFLDEFQNFTTLSVVNMASELRKFGCALTFVNQYLSQTEKEIKEAVLGNCGTLISFRLGAKDAAYIAKEFSPKFKSEDIVHLPNYTIYLKLMIDSSPSQPFSSKTIMTEQSSKFNLSAQDSKK